MRSTAFDRGLAHALASLIGWKQAQRTSTPTMTNDRSERVRLSRSNAVDRGRTPFCGPGLNLCT